MAQDFLSQEEVDALLKGVTGEPDEQEAEEHGGDGVRLQDPEQRGNEFVCPVH